MKGITRLAACVGAAVALGGLALAPGAGAAVPPSLHDPANCTELEPAPGLTAHHCDDGTPALGGGLIPNLSGDSAVTVPAKYGGDGHTGLPPQSGDAATMPGAHPLDGTIALDVNVTLPDVAPPPDGYPLLFFMHGCCGGNKGSNERATIDAPGEGWRYSNAWFAARGYVVVTYTARGFVNNLNQGSSGQTQLQSRSFEINDYQHLACQIHAAAPEFAAVSGHDVAVDPERVVVTGGSYGGGFSWLALTDPRWTCTADTGAAGTGMRLAAAAPKYGWTDLAYTLVPNGLHSQLPGELPATDGCDTGPRDLDGVPCPGPQSPIGTPKTSIVAGLFATGSLAVADHTTFTPEVALALTCLIMLTPLELNPACTSVAEQTLPEFLRERSAYYQEHYFERIADDPGWRVPVFNAATFTDPLFPAYEHRRMINRLLAVDPDYPIATHFGDYQHFAQNKAKEWGDICDSGDGRGRRVCEFDDYPGGDLDAEPEGLVRTGITTRLNRFLDHHARPPANPDQPDPELGATASLQVCPPNAGPDRPLDEPGPAFSAPTFEQIAPNTLGADLRGAQTTLWQAVPNLHALSADPVLNEQLNDAACPVETTDAGLGVATYTSEPLAEPATMVGSGEAAVDFELLGPSEGLQLNARLYDLFPDGRAVMVDRGTRRIAPGEAAAGEAAIPMHGNGWRFEPGHRLRIELAQDDLPFVRSTDIPSSLTLSGLRLELPIREPSRELGGAPPDLPDPPDPADPPDPPDPPGPGDPPGPPGGPGDRGGPPGGRGGAGAGVGLGDPGDRREAAAGRRPSAESGAGGAGLPFTGLEVAGLLAVALALLAGGGAARRRRR